MATSVEWWNWGIFSIVLIFFIFILNLYIGGYFNPITTIKKAHAKYKQQEYRENIKQFVEINAKSQKWKYKQHWSRFWYQNPKKAKTRSGREEKKWKSYAKKNGARDDVLTFFFVKYFFYYLHTKSHGICEYFEWIKNYADIIVRYYGNSWNIKHNCCYKYEILLAFWVLSFRILFCIIQFYPSSVGIAFSFIRVCAYVFFGFLI